MELAVRESEARLRLVLGASRIGVWDWNPTTNEVHYSDEWKAQLGYGTDELSNSMDELERRLHPEDLAGMMERKAALIAGTADEIADEFRLRHRDGSWRWIQSRGVVVRDAAGRAQRMLGCHVDVTELKLAGERAADAERNLRAAFDATPDALFVQDVDGRILDANAAAVKRYGYSRDELRRMNTRDLAPVELRDLADETRHNAMATGEAVDWRHMRRDGTVIPVEVLLRPVTIGGQQALLATARDITERARSTESLRQSERRLRDLIDGLGPGVFVGLLTPDGILVEVNRPTLEAAGLRPADLVGKHLEDTVLFVHAAREREQVREAVRRAGRGIGARLSLNLTMAQRLIHVDLSLLPHRDGRGQVSGIVASATDVTDQKRAEVKLKERQQRLALSQRVAHVGSWSIDLRTKRMRWSDEMYRICGTQPEHFIPSIEAMLELVTPADRPLAEVRFHGWLNGEWSSDLLFRLRRPSGDERVVNARVELVVDAANVPVRLEGTLHDVTELRVAADLLEQRNRTLRLFVEYSPAAIAMFDRDMKYVAASRRWSIDYRLGDQPLVGRSHYEVFPNLDERWKGMDRRCLAGAVERCEQEELRRVDGTVDWVHWESRPWFERSGEIGGIIVFSEVITDRVLREHALRESEARLREAQRNARIGSWTLKAAGELIFSDQMFELFPLSRSEPVTLATIRECVHPDDRKSPDDDPLARGIATGAAKVTVEFRTVWPDGRVLWLYAIGEIARDANGAFVEAAGTVQDISERKHADEARRQVRRRLRQLSRRLLELQEADRRQIASELHDELGQVLTTAKINVQSLLQHSENSSHVSRLTDSVSSLDRALKQVRSMSLRLRPQMLDDFGLSPSLRWLTQRYDGVDGLVVDVTDGVPEVRYDSAVETACFRIAQEALTNVAKHARARRVRVELREVKDELHLYVRDDGVGFDLRAARQRAAHGAGMGLVGMEERARLAGGRIVWHSEPNGGTSVHARFGARKLRAPAGSTEDSR